MGGSEHLLWDGAGFAMASENICELSKADTLGWSVFSCRSEVAEDCERRRPGRGGDVDMMPDGVMEDWSNLDYARK